MARRCQQGSQDEREISKSLGSGSLGPCGSESVLRLLQISSKQSLLWYTFPPPQERHLLAGGCSAQIRPAGRLPVITGISIARAVGLKAVGKCWLGLLRRELERPSTSPCFTDSHHFFLWTGLQVLFPHRRPSPRNSCVLPGSEKVSRRCSPSP